MEYLIRHIEVDKIDISALTPQFSFNNENRLTIRLHNKEDQTKDILINLTDKETRDLITKITQPKINKTPKRKKQMAEASKRYYAKKKSNNASLKVAFITSFIFSPGITVIMINDLPSFNIL